MLSKIFQIFDMTYSNFIVRDALRASIRQLPEHPTASQRTVIEEKRQKLTSRINKFNSAAMVMTNGMELEGGEGVPQDDPELCLEEADGDNFLRIEDAEGDCILDMEGEADSPAEVAEVWMPSLAASDTIMDDVITALRQEELKLRKGQANDCLEKLRQALGDRSVVFREKIHSNKSIHHQGTRSKKELLTITLSINKQARGYRRSRAAMQRLGADLDTLALYQPLRAQDLGVSKEITEENRHGQGSDALTWFWRINKAVPAQPPPDRSRDLSRDLGNFCMYHENIVWMPTEKCDTLWTKTRHLTKGYAPNQNARECYPVMT
jgi:hypothetical protein